ncbi:MAG: hypothetical protein JXA99_06910 [Candidatus Lokiarchaeota archaeon]|nr:hypothetical protein [Candidatus Lokiarchaeota archaeon]
MDKRDNKNEIVRISYNLAKGTYIRNVYYENETEKDIIFKNNNFEKSCLIPKSFVQKGWKRNKKSPQNIYISSYLSLLKIYWQKYDTMNE